MPKTSLRVIVVGGSMGGLTAALVLRKIGYDVDVFERSSALLESRGAGIISHRITLRYPTEFGGYQLGDLSIRPLWCRYFDGQGRVVSERPCGFRVNSYGALYRSLLHCFGQERYHLGRSVTGFREDAGKVLPPALTELVVRTRSHSSRQSSMGGSRPWRSGGFVSWAMPHSWRGPTVRRVRQKQRRTRGNWARR